MSNPHNNSLMNVNLINGVAGFYAAVGLLQMGFLFSVGFGLEALFLIPILFLYLGSLLIARRQDLVVAGVMFITTALIHVGLGNFLFFPSDFGMHRTLLVLMPSTFLLLPLSQEKWINGLTIVNIVLCIVLEGLNPDPVWTISISAHFATSVRLISTLTSTITTTAIVYYFYLHLRQQQKLLRVEHRRSEELLHNLFPPSIVHRLKLQERTIADNYEDVTVIFADIVGFTKMSEEMEPEKLLYVLNKFFGEFDQIAQRMGVEKIKTIGDAYMAVCGAPTPDSQHKQKAMRFAAALLLAMERLNVKLDSNLSIRIGLHSGPVVAGVIGRQKSIYDLWGDTVNTASRMESSGIPDYIQISDALYDDLKDDYPLHARGAQRIKGKKALLHTYLMSLEELRRSIETEQNLPKTAPPEWEHEETVTLKISDFR